VTINNKFSLIIRLTILLLDYHVSTKRCFNVHNSKWDMDRTKLKQCKYHKQPNVGLAVKTRRILVPNYDFLWIFTFSTQTNWFKRDAIHQSWNTVLCM